MHDDTSRNSQLQGDEGVNHHTKKNTTGSNNKKNKDKKNKTQQNELSSLYGKLVKHEIDNEDNMILQCFHYFVQTGFAMTTGDCSKIENNEEKLVLSGDPAAS